MKKDRLIKIILWIIVIAVAVLIFCFSAENAADSNDTSGRFLRMILGLLPGFRTMTRTAQADMILALMNVVRKCAHFSIYAFLGFWLLFLVRQYRLSPSILIATGAAFLYAITDELHQFFVPGRACQFRDVCIDTAGALTGALIAALIVAIWQKLRKYRAKGK